MKYSRKDYLDGKCTHREYYSQFVTESHRQSVLDRFGEGALLKSFRSPVFSPDHIPLEQWDAMAPLVKTSLTGHGDRLTRSGQVCILKEAARQVCERAGHDLNQGEQ